MTTHTLFITGMHCTACSLLIEDVAQDVLGAHATITVSYAAATITVRSTEKDASALVAQLGPVLAPHGYTISDRAPQASRSAKDWRELGIAAAIAIALGAGFLLLQHAGLEQYLAMEMGPILAFMVGVVASLSSCLALVGGLALALSAHYTECGQKRWPQLMFHSGRLVSFVLLGGVLGAAGRSMTLSLAATTALTVLVGCVMIITGVSLLGLWRVRIGMPDVIARLLQKHAARPSGSTWPPLAIGAGTFFLPCGFTQSMQSYALTTGSFAAGASIMGAFALGTLPVLALVSFGVGSFSSSKMAVTIKAAGFLVIATGLWMIVNMARLWGVL